MMRIEVDPYLQQIDVGKESSRKMRFGERKWGNGWQKILLLCEGII